MEIRIKCVAGLSRAPTIIIRDDAGIHIAEFEVIAEDGKQLVHTYIPVKELKRLKKLYAR